MALSAVALTDSEYYSSDFNGAIFDGSFRIYFAQYQEEQALKVYFHLRNFFEQSKGLKVSPKSNIFILLYSDKESFFQFFSERTKNMHIVNFDAHKIIACHLPFKESEYVKLVDVARKCTNFLVEAPHS